MKRIKKLLAALTSAVMMAVLPASMPTGATTQSRQYTKHVIATNQTSTYTLTQTDQSPTLTNSMPDSMQAIIHEPDDRVNGGINGVVQLYRETGAAYGTGFIVGDHQIACSAHQVYRQDIYPASTDYFVPSMTVRFYDEDGVLDNNSTVSVSEIHIPTANIPSGNASTDYALLTVSADLSDYPHFELGYTCDYNSSEFRALDLFVTGSLSGALMSSKGHVCSNKTSTDTILYFDANTANGGGTSGGPVFMATECTNGNKVYRVYTAFGIVHGGIQGQYNSAHHIDSRDIQFYLNNSYASY